MFNATFYTFSKKLNSTKQPSVGSSYQIELKDSSGILSPIIKLDVGQSGNPTAYNYCYIAEFNRYYWVGNWRWTERLWTAECKVDPMASWKSHIGSDTEYIMRCASLRNQAIIDNIYPLITTRAINKVDITSPFASNITNGTFIVGINGYDDTGVGATQYYAFNNNYMRGFVYRLLSNINYMNLDFTEISEQLARGIINPMQYIASCIWVPFLLPGITYTDTPKVGWWEDRKSVV